MSALNKSDSSVLSGSCVYFKRTGRENTGKTLEVAAKKAEEFGIQNVLVATTSGETGLMAT
ncbi:MAG TPA: hypothetical protein ENH65_15735, partial [Candidatus Aminicenantes bacterium]|nr:hypothetical protein [Candidatus Aminicenantes bacterium]